MPLNEIVSFLQTKIAPTTQTEDDAIIRNFLAELKNANDINSSRLLASLSIDVSNSIVKLKTDDLSKNQFIKNLRACIIGASNSLNLQSFPKEITPYMKFSIAKTSITNTYLPCIDCNDNHSYSRVYEFSSYMLYVVRPNSSINPDVPDDIDINEVDRYLEDFKSGSMYNQLHVTRLGKSNSWVFVADKNDVNSSKYNSKTNKATEIIDRLGFYMQNIANNKHYICLEYDDSFQLVTFQPDSLTADWGGISVNGMYGYGNEFYLSSPTKEGNWGLTCSVTGQLNGVKERVHRDFDFNELKEYKMQANSIGILNVGLMKCDDKDLLGECIERYKEAKKKIDNI